MAENKWNPSGSFLEDTLIAWADEAVREYGEDKVAAFAQTMLGEWESVDDIIPLGSKFERTLGKCELYLTWDYDADIPYVSVGFTFYSGRVLAEIESGTFGELQWFRVYL